MAIEIEATTFYALVFLLIITMSIVNKQGGIKIVSWRIRGKRGFLITMIEPDKKVLRKPLPMKIVHNSTPRFTFDGGEYFTGGPDETAYAFGMPNWVYMRGDSRPLKLVHTGELMSASKIHSAFEDDANLNWNVAVGMVSPDEKLQQDVDAAVQAVLADGTLAKIYARYDIELQPPQ